MGHKVNPKSFRLGQTITWSSRWFAKKDYADILREDVLIRKLIVKKLREAVIEKVEIERSAADLTVIITAGRPGVIIGRGGSGIEEIKQAIIKSIFKNQNKNIKINIQEVEDPNLSAGAILHFLIADIEKRMPFRRVMKQAIDRVMKTGAKGVKIIMSGRLNGVDISRTETLSEGKVPLHTLRANIDYSRGVARTTYGAIGIKVWIYKGEVFEFDNEEKKKPKFGFNKRRSGNFKNNKKEEDKK
ncbi:MAG: 30S ribosomal protein S3 [Candidatus Komeilibacteria bacterium CG10_big_fil_rev_8_21_14_0_10_41_13]|uniref:Small ribosomal subunit protein uS3 n=1 Tax=Candidatus Komeilibacteria bacterium CG10_big_fil_rev_8_21_14_0_10_41_13 TaxID=1974476 RepID=A0A2M6WDI1_9BACT|nr:MAG: 30S ribosomal protein S3 [Candidatus Komeilibacteria bacterium CG10_big_fil_rev_8_21_14_0_10_41_13]